MNRSTPGLRVQHKLLEFTQTHAHRVGDAIQPSHPLSSPSPPALNLSQHQCLFPTSQLFTWGGQSTGVSASESVLPVNTQDLSPLGWTGWISLQSTRLSKVFSNTTVQNRTMLEDCNSENVFSLLSLLKEYIVVYWKQNELISLSRRKSVLAKLNVCDDFFCFPYPLKHH